MACLRCEMAGDHIGTNQEQESIPPAHDESKRAVEERLPAQVPVPLIPGAVLEIPPELGRETALDRGIDKAPGGAGEPRAGIEQALRAAVVGLAESVAAIQRDRDGNDVDRAA